ncbi:MAG: HD domain-containing protein [Gemmatimonadota bacterium]|nr:HD domain-containing protein [Gemmatimonadota bacterium]
MKRAVAFAAGALAGAIIIRERRARGAAERFAAASLETLLNAIDANDAQTGAHVRRVAAYALIIADAAGLRAREKQTVERVALFHDIGKIHEALFDIIHDETTLTPEDRRAIATHPRRGATVLAPLCAFDPDLADGVLSHHERWDGGGYPRGLRGPRIPLAARIVTLADTFDAITRRRRYRDPRNARHAADAIAAERGGQFDPQLVDLMLLPPVWERIVKAHREAHRRRHARHERREGRQETPVPKIKFRWRHGGRESPAQPQPSRTPR